MMLGVDDRRAYPEEKKNKIIFPSKLKKKKTPWSETASELYRPSDRRLSA
jgi:hypothetical protein